MENKKIPLICVVGPTASGKTRLGIELAKKYNGEIVSADSMQIYKGISIASAVATKTEMQGIPHHLLEFLEIDDAFSVADYVNLAKEKIIEIYSRGKQPILVGGTGLYVNSLVDGISFAEQKGDKKVLEELKKELECYGAEYMLNKLKEIDPETAKKLHPNNERRILRALEVYKTTGKTMTKQNELSKMGEPLFDTVMIGITYNDREKLYDRINLRVDKMLENSLLEEAKTTLSLKNGVGAAQAIGHKELHKYLKGEVTLEEAVETLKRETRRYAKRQLTWFRRREDINWVFADTEDVLKKASEIIDRRRHI